MFNPGQLIELIPKASVWAQQQEQEILKSGVPLTGSQLEDAKRASVQHPGRIKLLRVDQIPLPEDQELSSAAQAIGLTTPGTRGLTLQYGIFIRSDHWDDRNLVVHELVHTSQYERLGGIEEFLNQYLTQCVRFGYPNAPLELEAKDTARSICT